MQLKIDMKDLLVWSKVICVSTVYIELCDGAWVGWA